MQAPATPRHVVIVGGGFGGLCAAQKLAGVRGVQVTIIDRRNHHLFQPLLYQVATAALSPAEIAYPIRTIFSGKRNVRVLLDRAVAVDLGRRVLVTADTELPYDNLILACGARHSYFGHDEWEPFAPGLKSLEEATEIRRRMLTAFELAEKETDPARQRKLLTFVVIGGGPTGVELAGALGEISRFTLAKDFRNIDPRRTRVILIEAGPRILSAFDESLAHRATTDLESLGVTVWTSTRVTRVDEEGVTLGTETVQAATILWAAGVAPSELNKSLGVPSTARAASSSSRTAPSSSTPRSSSSATRPTSNRTARSSPASPPSPCSRAASSAATSAGSSQGGHERRFATATRARWPPSAAAAPSSRSVASSSAASSPGSPGCSYTSSTSSASRIASRCSSTGPGTTSPSAAAPA